MALKRVVLLTAALAALVAAQNKRYDGPRPAKPDVPYLLHAVNLISTDVTEARESKSKDGVLYTIDGPTAQARTPLMEPIFLLAADKLIPEKLACWKLEVKNGRRELSMLNKPKKDSGRPLRLIVSRVGDNIYRVELGEPLENGEYVLSPDGSNQSFAFTVY
jgi:hypothetical protein